MTSAANANAKFSAHVTRQLLILSICRFAEPVALTSVFPYIYYMMASFGVPTEDISFYAGITSGSFSFCQFFTGILWGRASDKYGRKPCILLGLLGTLTCMLLFGFSTSLPMAICARSLAGLVNGNVGILRTTVAELVPQKALQPRAFSIMPLIWAIGSVLGPMIGGALADPLRNHPEWFHGTKPALFRKFPYALPNLAAALPFLIGVPIGILFLEETLAVKKGRRDPGLALGHKIMRSLGMSKSPAKDGLENERTSLVPNHPTSDEEGADNTAATAQPNEKAPPLSAAITPQSAINILVYGLLALHSTAFDQLLPILMAYPPEDPSKRSGFKFAGGFGMSSSEVGFYFSIYGITGMVLQFFVFPPVASRLGSLRCLKIAAYTFAALYVVLPFLALLPEDTRKPAIIAVLFIKCMCGTFAFPCSTILLTNSSPSLRVLGTLNGIAVATAALGRATGPATFGLAFSYGQETGYLIFPWWLLAAITFMSALPTALMTEGDGFDDDSSDPSDSDSIASEQDLTLTKTNSVVSDYGTLVTSDEQRRRSRRND